MIMIIAIHLLNIEHYTSNFNMTCVVMEIGVSTQFKILNRPDIEEEKRNQTSPPSIQSNVD